MGEMQNKGIITLKNKTILPSGMIEADVWYNGMQISKGTTFFPETWTREKTIEKVSEALCKSTKRELKNKRLVIEGIAENINIRIICHENGELVTFYPFIPEEL